MISVTLLSIFLFFFVVRVTDSYRMIPTMSLKSTSKFASTIVATIVSLNTGFGIVQPNSVNAQQLQSVFTGSYHDPNHPNCLRKVSSEGKEITILGSDNIDGSDKWLIKAKENQPGKMLVDFSPKGGPKDLLGIYNTEKNGIQWPDGNLWSKLTN